MKREILFRAKTANPNTLPNHKSYWVYGLIEDSRIKEFPYSVDGCFVIPETIGQFTGLTDSDIDGNLVFEGDVIENCDTKQLQVVFWHEEKAAWYCRYIIDSDRIVSLANSIGNLNKVIGNIHDNPELLK